MAENDAITNTKKRKYDDTNSPDSATCKPTEFSAPVIPPSPDQSLAAPLLDKIQPAKQRPQEIVDRLSAAAAVSNDGIGSGDDKRAKVDDVSGFGNAIPVSYGLPPSKKIIDIPSGRVRAIIGKSGDTVKHLQLQSGAKIQFICDTDADPNSVTRPVELLGTPEQIARVEQLIHEVLAEAEQSGSGISKGLTGQTGLEQFVMKIHDSQVGLVIGKGGETIKTMQARSGARMQVIPLRKLPGDMSTERTVQILGTREHIEAAKQFVNEIISGDNRLRNPTVGGGYSQQGYQARLPMGWGPPRAPLMLQPRYAYVRPGSYPGMSTQYNMGQSPYRGHSQSIVPPSQQTSQGSGHEYYNLQPPGVSTHAGDNTGYNNNQPPTSGYSHQGQGYALDGYGVYQALPPYDQHQSYNSAIGYGYNRDSYQGPSPVQPSEGQGYSGAPLPSPPKPASYPPQGSTQPGYGAPPTTRAGYGNLPSAQSGYRPGHGIPQTQKPVNPSVYGPQPQQSPSTAGGYAQPSVQPGYPHSQPAPSAFAQVDSGVPYAPPFGYGASGYGPPPASQSGYRQAAEAPPSYGSYGGGYPQTQPGYAADVNTSSSNPASQTNQQGGIVKSFPQS